MPKQISSPEQPFQVRFIAEALKDWVGRLGAAWIEGELTSWDIRGGHAYAKLRDLNADASLQLVVWRNVLARTIDTFSKGDRVLVHAKPDVWVKGGSLSMQVYEIRHAGIGTLLEQLERLKRQLAAEGLFAEDRKVPLPFLPQRIGLITGRDSDAEKDVRRNAELRWPAVRFRVLHTSTQGDHAVAEVSAALRELDADPEIDVIIVARGGGDFLNLLPFSDESLVRLAATIETPLVSAIGHEADRPILDEVADLRASTPTDAAKRVVPDVAEQLALVAQYRARIRQRLTDLVAAETRTLTAMRSRPVLANPMWLVDRRGDELGRLATRGAELVERGVERAAVEVSRLRGQLRALSPEGTLARGYSIVERRSRHAADATIVTSTAQVRPEDALSIRVRDGRIAASVVGTAPAAGATPSDDSDDTARTVE